MSYPLAWSLKLRISSLVRHTRLRLSVKKVEGHVGLTRSLGHPTLSTIQRLVISKYKHPRWAKAGECPIFQTLSSANNLQTLVSMECNHRPFILALDPDQNPSNLVICPKMEKLILYTRFGYLFDVELLIAMAKNRSSRGVKLVSITLVDPGGDEQREEVLRLRQHFKRVEYKFYQGPPAWDDVIGESVGESR